MRRDLTVKGAAAVGVLTTLRSRLVMGLITTGLLVAAVGTTQAATINISTGTDGSGAVLADGASDPRWLVSVAGGPFAAAVVSYPADQCCSMHTVDATRAKWINNVTTQSGATSDGWNNNPPTVFRRTFDLSAFDLSTVGLTGVWRVADGAQAFLNGNLLFSAPAVTGPTQNTNNWAADNPLSVSAGSPFFVAGVNTLEFRAETLNAVYDGVYLYANVSGDLSPVPEPGMIALLATALGALAVRRRTH